jgi:uncharacterized cupin superfamily protein
MKRVNIFKAQYHYDDSDPPGYRAGMVRVGDIAGGEALAVKLFELPAGEDLCPYHYEYEEEWLVVLDGAITLRVPDGEHLLDPGDVVCFPPGKDGAHKVRNNSDAPAHALMFSSARAPAVAVYPDSDKILMWPGNAEDRVMLRRGDGKVDYYDGET